MTRSTDEVTVAIRTLFRLGGSRRIHQQQTEAAGVALTPQALRVLERTVDGGATTPGQLAEALDLDPATVTRLLGQLGDAGLVRRGRSAADGRVSTVAATPGGEAALARVRAVIWDQVRRSLVAWPEEDVAVLASLLGRLVADVQKEPYRPVSPSPSGALRTPSG
jgi:DNA-binding MarR family transcriptional regulator